MVKTPGTPKNTAPSRRASIRAYALQCCNAYCTEVLNVERHHYVGTTTYFEYAAFWNSGNRIELRCRPEGRSASWYVATDQRLTYKEVMEATQCPTDEIPLKMLELWTGDTADRLMLWIMTARLDGKL